MSIATQSIREIVSRQPSAAGIFHKFDIDLCHKVDLSVEEACRELQLSVDQVLEKLADAKLSDHGSEAFDPSKLSLTRLIQHIVRIHHHSVRQELPILAEMASKVAAINRNQEPELFSVARQIENLRGELYNHIQKEEQILFPFISQMEEDSIAAYPPSHVCFGSVTHPIFMMEQEHESAQHLMDGLLSLTNCFEPPVWACATHIALFVGLRKFETGLRDHVRLENDVLFPRAIQLEAKLKGRSE